MSRALSIYEKFLEIGNRRPTRVRNLYAGRRASNSRTRIRVGVPVHVHYIGEGDSVMVDRVVLDED
jgi:hypothetical protein